MPLTIIFHGTSDTHYADDQAYLRQNLITQIGEGSHTLSYFADCMAINDEQVVEPIFSIVEERRKDQFLLSFRNELVILQGPDDSGTYVHNVIVSGLMAALNALMRGETEINFIGFSRGSVEAIHMTHELQRIQDYINNPSSDLSAQAIATAISEGCYNPYSMYPFRWRTQRINDNYLDALRAALENSTYLNALITGIKDPRFKLNGMLLDPVPGLCEGSQLTYLAWTAMEHHTSVPPMVSNLIVAYMDSEFSVGFRAVWVEPTPNSQTKIAHIHFPGCHSTANGNPVTQTPALSLATNPPFPFQALRGVQKVFFYKLLQFASKHGVSFKSPHALTGRFLTPVFEHFMVNEYNISAQNDYVLEQYQEIAKNFTAYRKTRETCYIPEWLNNIGLGGRESLNQERILMDKDGPRSIAELFGFDITGASWYVNFDHFSLDLMRLLFPELRSSPETSPVSGNMSYSMMSEALNTRYASPTMDMDYISLSEKIKAILDQSQMHQLDTNLNKILLSELDHAGILAKLTEVVPTKLANSFYHSNLRQIDVVKLQEVIALILSFDLIGLGDDEQTEQHQQLFSKKQEYIQKFKSNMNANLMDEAQKYLASLISNAEQFQRRATYSVLNSPSSTEQDVSPSMTIITYLSEAERYYQELKMFQEKLALVETYFDVDKHQFLQFKIDEAIAQFPLSCERVVTRVYPQATIEFLARFAIMQPLFERADFECAFESQRQQNAVLQSRILEIEHQIASLSENLHLERDKNFTLDSAIEAKQQILDSVMTDKNKLEETLNTLILAQENIKLETERSLQTKQDRIETLQGALEAIRARLELIQNTIQTAQSAGQHSGIVLQIACALIIALGMFIAALSAAFLLMGTGSLPVLVPVMSACMGTALAGVGLFGLREGIRRQRDHQLRVELFPETASFQTGLTA